MWCQHSSVVCLKLRKVLFAIMCVSAIGLLMWIKCSSFAVWYGWHVYDVIECVYDVDMGQWVTFVRERWKRRSTTDKWRRRRCHSVWLMNIRLTGTSQLPTCVNSTSSIPTDLTTPLHPSDLYRPCLRFASATCAVLDVKLIQGSS